MKKCPQILLVEDDNKDIELALESLKESNLENEIQVVTDGEEALDYLYSREKFLMRYPENPVLILLDLKIPKIEGLEVLQTIKNDQNLKEIPVIILTSSRMESDMVESKKQKANGYLIKPINPKELFQLLKKIGLFWEIVNLSQKEITPI